jgi:CheY-like chemotaxis protein
MPRVALVHWKPVEVAERLARLRAAGFEPEAGVGADGPTALRNIRNDPPDAVVIDLSRLPSHGREVATALRQSAVTRRVPLVFVEGEPAKVAAIRALLPDATYASWAQVGPALRAALRNPPAQPVVPDMMEKYADTPLAKKLGIRDGGSLLLINAPAKFPAALRIPSELNVRVVRSARRAVETIILFAVSEARLSRSLPAAQRCMAEKAALWIAWPKRTSGVETDLTQYAVRARALAAGLVDYKICALDATWSALCFARAKRAMRRPGVTRRPL